MTCFICQFALNLGIAVDRLVNTILLGDPNETLSRRLGRARDKGHHVWAMYICSFLSVLFMTTDHCSFAEEPGTMAKELWAWSPDYTEPEYEIDYNAHI